MLSWLNCLAGGPGGLAVRELEADGNAGHAWRLAHSEAAIARSPFGIAIIDAEGRYVSVNPAYCRIYGYQPEQLVGASFTTVFPEQARAAVLALHTEFLDRGHSLSGEWPVRRQDGSELVVMSESVSVIAADGRRHRLVYVVDITARTRAEAVARAREASFRALFETLPIGVVYHDLEGRVTAANPAALHILGLSLPQLQGRTPLHPEWRAIREDGTDFPGEQHPASVALRTGRSVEDVIMGIQSPGRGLVWLRVNSAPVMRDGALQEVYASFEDITASVNLAAELRAQAQTDYLTGALNRRSFISHLGAQFERLRRHPELQAAVMIVDVDHFKQVNDNFGHAVGDQVLRHITGLMQGAVRRGDQLGRYGGEEFALLLPDTGLDAAVQLAERLRQAIERHPMQRGELRVPVTVSIGVSLLDRNDPAAESTLLRADEALYAAKRSGRNRVELRVPGAA